MLTIFTKLKLWGAAFFAFFIAICSARHYQKKSKRLEKKITKQKAITSNQQDQLKAIIRHKTNNQREIDDALKDGSYMDFFDSE